MVIIGTPCRVMPICIVMQASITEPEHNLMFASMQQQPARPLIALLIVIAVIAGCSEKRPSKEERSSQGKGSSPEKMGAKGSAGTGILARYDLDTKNPTQIELPSELREISGIALTADGRLFAHGDERAIIYQIDPTSGAIIKRFQLGPAGVKDDFEDIAIVDSIFYLVTSSGDIYRFTEGADDTSVEFEVFKTRLSSDQDVEGLCHDPTIRALLLACKGKPESGSDEVKAIYSFSLERMSLDEKPRFLLPVDELVKGSKGKEFNPSAILRHPESGSLLLLAAQGNGIVEIDAGGKVVGHVGLRGKVHAQPEGIALAGDNTLLVSDEGNDGKGVITRYPLLH